MGLVHKNNDLHCAGRPKAIPRTFMPRSEAAAAEVAAAEAAEVAAEASRSGFGGGFGGFMKNLLTRI